MLLSVIVPMYNAERFAERCVENLLRQGVPEGGLEIVAVDDGSDDGTARILRSLAAGTPCLKVVEIDHAGLGAARNAGSRAASGDLVYFMGCDDALEPGSLPRLADRMAGDGLDLLLLSGRPEFENERLARERADYARILKRVPPCEGVVDGKGALLSMVSEGRFCPCAPLMMLSVRLVRENGLLFPEGIINEDNPFVLAALLAARRVGFDTEDAYIYRVREGSLTGMNRSGGARLLAHLELLRLFEAEAVEQEGLGRRDVAAAIRELDSWFAEVCVRESAGSSIDDSLLDPRFSRLAPIARMASVAASERSRADEALSRVEELEREVEALRSSSTWRAGRAVTALPRLLKRALSDY